MLKNYFTIAWRNLMKNKVFSFINVLGLTIGITVCMMIFLFIMNEFSFDKFHKDGDRIYEVMRIYDSTKPSVPWLSGPYAPALLNDFPNDIKRAVRVMPSNFLVTFGNKAFNEKKVYRADPDFFQLFSFPLIKGNPATVLQDPNSIVISETSAKKYFGDEDPIGKVLTLDKKDQLKVTGVVKDVPFNSHLDFDMVRSIANLNNEEFFKRWINNNNFTYVLLDEHADKNKLQRQFPAFMNKYMGKDMAQYGMHFSISLTPVGDVYLKESSAYSTAKHGDEKVVYIFLSIAVLILLIACINFMNLSTIRAVERSKEVGLRKVMGALRNHLVWQFIGESVLLTGISCMLSIGLLQLLMPVYSNLLGYELKASWSSIHIYFFLLGVILVVGFLAGSYPAFFLSAFSPIQALKGKLKLGKGGSFFRQALVVVQFSITVLLIVGTIVIVSQMDYVRKKELGYDKEHTIIIPIDNGDFYDHMDAFKEELSRKNNIQSVAMMSGEPGGFFDGQTFEVEGRQELVKSRTEFTDFGFVQTLGVKIIAGRNFSPQYATDTAEAILINRSAAKEFGFTPEQAIGKWIRNTVRDTARRRIIGVTEDFNFLSLKENMDALVIAPNEDRRVALVKFKGGDIPGALKTVKEAYNKVAPAYPFEYTFLDQKFDVLYKKDVRQQNILSIFSGLAIFIACMGLFGLASFAAAKRTKEIGVRKVLGSSRQNIVVLLSTDLLKPVIIATCIALPAGYYIMTNWLQNFAYRTPLHWWIFVLAAVITFAIALFTVGVKALKAAGANPVKSLRSE